MCVSLCVCVCVCTYVYTLAQKRNRRGMCVFHIIGGWKVGCAAVLLGGNAKIILVFVPPWKGLQKSYSRTKISRVRSETLLM